MYHRLLTTKLRYKLKMLTKEDKTLIKMSGNQKSTGD